MIGNCEHVFLYRQQVVFNKKSGDRVRLSVWCERCKVRLEGEFEDWQIDPVLWLESLGAER